MLRLFILSFLVVSCGSQSTERGPRKAAHQQDTQDSLDRYQPIPTATIEGLPHNEDGDVVGEAGADPFSNRPTTELAGSDSSDSVDDIDGVRETSGALNWKGVFMTGDDSIRAFDNGRRDVAAEWAKRGVVASQTRHLSMASSQQTGGVEASNRDNLRKAFSQLSPSVDDGCLLFMTSHGSRSGFYMGNQSALRPNEFADIINEACGNRPTVLLISACYSGIFLDNSAGLKADNRVILTAARPDRTSFGCGAENVYTYWDGCLIDSIAGADSWRGLYDDVNACVQRKESRGSYTPSEPQVWIGKDMESVPLPNIAP